MSAENQPAKSVSDRELIDRFRHLVRTGRVLFNDIVYVSTHLKIDPDKDDYRELKGWERAALGRIILWYTQYEVKKHVDKGC